MNIDTNQNSTSNYIIDTVLKIDRMQKEAVINEENSCVTCANSLVSFQNNTLPISFIMRSGGYLTTNLSLDNETTTIYYKIEAVRSCRYVTLRKLENISATLQATPQTLIVDLECVCAIECHSPIQTTNCNLE